MSDKTKHYTNGELTVVWNADLCHHAAECVNGLPDVFKPKERPWIQAEECATDALKATIDKCPSGALSYFMNEEGAEKQEPTPTPTLTDSAPVPNICRAQVIENGPLIVHANVTIEKSDGTTEVKENRASFCRCGASANKPYCDGGHKKIGFKG